MKDEDPYETLCNRLQSTYQSFTVDKTHDLIEMVTRWANQLGLDWDVRKHKAVGYIWVQDGKNYGYLPAELVVRFDAKAWDNQR